MRNPVLFTLAVATGITTNGAAQVRPVVTGETVRVQLGSGPVIGSVLHVTDSTLRLDTGSGQTTLSRADIRFVERRVRRPFHFSVPLAAAGAAFGVWQTADQSGGTILATGAALGLVAGILGNGGSSAGKGAVIGGAVGAGAGLFIGMATYTPCSGWFCLAENQGEWALLTSILVGGLGAVTGMVIGAATPDQGWDLAGFAPTVRASRNGIRIGLNRITR